MLYLQYQYVSIAWLQELNWVFTVEYQTCACIMQEICTYVNFTDVIIYLSPPFVDLKFNLLTCLYILCLFLSLTCGPVNLICWHVICASVSDILDMYIVSKVFEPASIIFVICHMQFPPKKKNCIYHWLSWPSKQQTEVKRIIANYSSAWLLSCYGSGNPAWGTWLGKWRATVI